MTLDHAYLTIILQALESQKQEIWFNDPAASDTSTMQRDQKIANINATIAALSENEVCKFCNGGGMLELRVQIDQKFLTDCVCQQTLSSLAVGVFHAGYKRAQDDALHTLPIMPQLDWPKAPGWAKAHVYNCHGMGMWVGSDDLTVNMGAGSGWLGAFPSLGCDYSGYDLPIGLDWRQTLQRRPGVE